MQSSNDQLFDVDCKFLLDIMYTMYSSLLRRVKGWFEVVPEDGRPVEYFDTVGGITSVKPKRFLVRTSTVGYQLSVEDGVSCWMPCEIKSGEVLTTGMVYMDNKKSKSHSQMRNLFRKILKTNKNAKKEQDLKYLQCYDSSGKEIMIPLIMSGVFSPVGESNNANYDAVYELQDLIMAFGLPVSSQLIHSFSKSDTTCPPGVLRLEGCREEEFVYLESVPSADPTAALIQGEIPLDSECTFSRELIKHSRKSKEKPEEIEIKDKELSAPVTSPPVEPIYSSSSIALPERVEKEMKKSKSAILLDKLSVRRTKKERAKLKALKEDDVFSKRLSRGEITYEDFYNGLDEETKPEEDKNAKTAKSSDNDSETYNKSTSYNNANDTSLTSPYGTTRSSIQDRDLPPIPGESKPHKPNKINDTDISDKESLYERLPPAPEPPKMRDMRQNSNPYDDEDDGGYMVPKNLRQDFDSPYQMRSDVYRRKPPSGFRDPSSRYIVKQRSCDEPRSGCTRTEEHECPIDIDNLFSFAYSQDPAAKPYGTIASNQYRSTSQLYGSTPGTRKPWIHHTASDADSRFMDTLDLQTRNKSGNNIRYKSRSQKNINMDANATIRSHNLRKVKNAMEVFHFTDSFRDLRTENGEGGQGAGVTTNPYNDGPNAVFYLGNDSTLYPDSEPGYRRYQRSVSANGISGLSESYIKQGDDSAISLCSRGEYGYHPDSDYSYGEYGEWPDDGWSPPGRIEHLTVQEISKSLRYIGMKDRVVLRFANEQIDGEMLCSLDKKLLKEGFPELNALEIKKIVDFVRGWRPKKRNNQWECYYADRNKIH
ncbi:uncharacterized protein LOC126818785 isoform X2 [Patella vulgata]|uniref:uncharacterized protein LOC126818785 isoform X2 n=1 Tax=Patella vulgata TaxID=6465 RepID=UPI00217FCB58|nr:uncharacterized protein LOC126818785 isoform X2 [Patella vulgata]